MKAAWLLDAKKGQARLEQLAGWLEQTHPDAAASLREGLSEMFTINRLGLPAKLRRCLGTTNIIESGHSGSRRRSGRVTRWRDGGMVLRWAAASHLSAEKNYKRIMGHEQLWQLKAKLDEPDVDVQRKVG
jgi:transposase-like protein